MTGAPATNGAHHAARRTILFGTVVWAAYVAGTGALALASGSSFESVRLLDHPDQLGIGAFTAGLPLTGAALLIGYLLPGLPIALARARPHHGPAETLVIAFTLSVALQIGLAMIPKLLGYTVTRGLFVALLFGPWALGSWRLWRRAQLNESARSVWPRLSASELVVVGVAFVAYVVVAADKVLREPFSGDGVEVFELTRSLRDYVLPHFLLEYDGPSARVATRLAVPPLALYYHFPLHVLVGDAEVAIRLAPIVFLPLVVVSYHRLVAALTSDGSSRAPLIIIAVVAGCFALRTTFYTTNNDYGHADIAMAQEVFAAALYGAALYALVRGRMRLFIILMVQAAWCRWQMMAVVGLTSAFIFIFRPDLRRVTVRLGVALVATVGALVLALVVTGEAGPASLAFAGAANMGSRTERFFLFITMPWAALSDAHLGRFAQSAFVYTGGAIVGALVLFPFAHPRRLTGPLLATMAVYAALIWAALGPPAAKVYVVGGVAFVPVVVALVAIARVPSALWRRVAYAGSAVIAIACLVVAAPTHEERQPNMFARDLGRQTYVAVYRDVDAAHAAFLLYLALRNQPENALAGVVPRRAHPLPLSPQTWVRESQVGGALRARHRFIIAPIGARSDGFRVAVSAHNTALLERVE